MTKRTMTASQMGRLGGKARAANMSPEARSEAARVASAARTRKADPRGRGVKPVSFRVSAGERIRLEVAAGKRGQPVGEYSREATLEAAMMDEWTEATNAAKGTP